MILAKNIVAQSTDKKKCEGEACLVFSNGLVNSTAPDHSFKEQLKLKK